MMLLRGDPLYNVSGVWEQLPYPALNGSIWSLQYDVWCFILMMILMRFKQDFAKPLLIVFIFVCAFFICYQSFHFWPVEISTGKFGELGIWFFVDALCAFFY
jgi:hypothetical protein